MYWLKKDLKLNATVILTARGATVTKNANIAVMQKGSEWVLYIKTVEKSDEGTYKCQINTNKPTSQTGYLKVVGKLFRFYNRGYPF